MAALQARRLRESPPHVRQCPASTKKKKFVIDLAIEMVAPNLATMIMFSRSQPPNIMMWLSKQKYGPRNGMRVDPTTLVLRKPCIL